MTRKGKRWEDVVNGREVRFGMVSEDLDDLLRGVGGGGGVLLFSVHQCLPQPQHHTIYMIIKMATPKDGVMVGRESGPAPMAPVWKLIYTPLTLSCFS